LLEKIRSRSSRRRIQQSRLALLLEERIIGQPNVADLIVPHFHMFQAHLSPPGRPAGIFLLLGPTGVGKTRTVEALAELIHGSDRHLLRIDCGEYQMDHEVAKLIGAPPGYLGHRETQPLLTQARLSSVTSPHCDLSLVLFDEVEKAAPSLTRLLLGVLDKATLRLGDNTTANFERSMIFMTSNVGAAEMARAMGPGYGFQGAGDAESKRAQLENVVMRAVRKRFAPEFLNRIDAIVHYGPLDQEALEKILDYQLRQLQRHIVERLRDRAFRIHVTPGARKFLLSRGTSPEYGAREIRRTVHREIVQPLAALMVEEYLEPGGTVVVELSRNGELHLRQA
jgi:ATP-dependent Clp protease ATP-binding subunit ClpA